MQIGARLHQGRMRAEDAIYGGEMSAHHYFKEFSYCEAA